MAMSQQIRQTQRQTITPAMMMEFSLLQLPIGELREAVKKELESNPALEVEKDPLAVGSSRSAPRSEDDGKRGFLENIADERGETLDEHLMSELRMNGVEGRELALAAAIAESLDGDGRFTGSYADLITVLNGAGVRGVTGRELEDARRRIMEIDPKGCGARDLAECYRAQMDRIPEEKRPAVEAAIDAIAGELGKAHRGAGAAVDIDPGALRLLKTLEPFPGRLYERAKTHIVVPDVIVDANGNVRVDQGDVPELRVSAKYVEMAKDRDLDSETRAYAAERVRRAREFREALVRRKETMEMIAEEVVARQPGYLEKGAAGLVRLTMSEVARKAKCTVATVSRAAARKYVRTPRGTVPLRRFFVLVDQAPVERLRDMLESIPAGVRVTDRELSERMCKAGFKMARRTVAKYRAKLGF